MLVISGTLVLSPAQAALPPGTPRILWDNFVTFGSITASSEAAGYPISNVTNPATNQEWRAAAAGAVEIAITIGVVDELSGVGIARHNFGSAGIALSLLGTSEGIDAYTKLLLHFDGSDASTSFVDECGHAFTANGNAHIDVGDFVFGGASGIFDGVDDYISTADHADFALGSVDWTLECRFTCTDAAGVNRGLAGQQATALAADTSVTIYRDAVGRIVGRAHVGSTTYVVTGTTIFTDVVNTGFHKVAFIRSGSTLKLFIDGVQEGGDVAITGSVNDVSASWLIGKVASQPDEWKGRIDEFRLSVGIARWTANYTPPDAPYPYTVLVQQFMPANDEPLLLQFTSQSLSEIVIALAEGDAAARAAVIYAGPMLMMPRGVDVDSDYLVPRMARKTEFAAPLSERGDYTGRIVTSQYISGIQHKYSHLESDFVREELLPFINAVQGDDVPFFYAMRADDGVSYDVAYLTFEDDPMPAHNPATGRYGVVLKMGGIVE